MNQTCIANDYRQAVIAGNILTCFTNRGIKRFAWTQIWPAVEIDDVRKINRAAKIWVQKGKPPEELQ